MGLEGKRTLLSVATRIEAYAKSFWWTRKGLLQPRLRGGIYNRATDGVGPGVRGTTNVI